MKKFFSFILVLMLLFSFNAMAVSPSITINDLTAISNFYSSTGSVINSDFAISITEENDFSTFIRSEIDEWLKEANFSVNDFFPADLNLPDVSLAINEVIPIDFANYELDYGDLVVSFDLPIKYTEEDTVAVVLGIMSEATVEWISLPVAVMPSGGVEVTFEQETIEQISAHDAALLVLND